MARARKEKSEFDAILEQLKKNYDSESSLSLEDDLLETPSKEEDVELNELLSRIFSSDNDAKKDKSKKDAEDRAFSEELYREIAAAAEEDAAVAKDASAERAAEDDTSVVNEDASVEKAAVEEVKAVKDDESPILEKEGDAISVSFEKEETSIDGSRSQSASEKEQEVEDVLNLMFASKSKHIETANNDVMSLMTEAVSDGSAIDADQADQAVQADQKEEDTELLDCPLDDGKLLEDSFSESEIEDDLVFAAEQEEPLDRFASSIEDDEELIFAVEDEEYAVDDLSVVDEIYDDAAQEAIFPIDSELEQASESPKIVLLQEDYTDDPLQEGLPFLGSSDSFNGANESEKVLLKTANEKKAESFDENDISMLLKFGYGNEIKSKVGEKKTQEVLLENESGFTPDPYEKPFGFCNMELTDKSQFAEIDKKYRSDRKNIIILLSVISVISLFIFAVDIFFELLPDRIGSYPIVLTLEFSFVLAISVILYKKLISGILGILKLEMRSSSIYSFVTLLYGGYSVISVLLFFISYESVPDNLMMFGFFVSLYAVFSLVSDLMTCMKEYYAFRVIASSKTIFSAEKQKTFSSLSKKSKLKADDNFVYKVLPTEMISGYFRKTSSRKKDAVKPILLLGIVPIISLVVGSICFFFGKCPLSAVTAIMFTALLCVPFGYIINSTFVDYVGAKQNSKYRVAFIGNDAVEEMSKAELIIFKDTEAVEISAYTEIQPTKRNDTESTLGIAYELFRQLGGSLSKLKGNTSREKNNENHSIVINDVSENGIDIYFDASVSILLGDKRYMNAHNIKVKTDSNLSTATRGVDRSVIYMAFDGVPKLGFIVNSRIRLKFLRTAESLSSAGIRVFVETYEPHLNSLYFEQNKGDSIANIGVIKPEAYEESSGTKYLCDGCVVSGSDSTDLAYAIYFSKEMYKRRSFIKTINLIVSVLGVACACFLAGLSITAGGDVLIFQVFSEHMTLLLGIMMLAGPVIGIIESIRFYKKRKGS